MLIKPLNDTLETWLKGKIIRITDETNDTKRFWVEVPEVDKFDFIPGQFITLDLPIHEKPDKRRRCYSIASSPKLAQNSSSMGQKVYLT